jgi:hypothetical protein
MGVAVVVVVVVVVVVPVDDEEEDEEEEEEEDEEVPTGFSYGMSNRTNITHAKQANNGYC